MHAPTAIKYRGRVYRRAGWDDEELQQRRREKSYEYRGQGPRVPPKYKRYYVKLYGWYYSFTPANYREYLLAGTKNHRVDVNQFCQGGGSLKRMPPKAFRAKDLSDAKEEEYRDALWSFDRLGG